VSAFDKAPRVSRDERLFNVRVNGVDVATGILRDDCEAYLGKKLGFVQVYLTERPLEDRRHWYRQQHLPRVASLRCSDAERAKILARLHADRTIKIEYDAPADTGGSSQGLTA